LAVSLLFHGGATDQELARSFYPASVGKAKEIESVWFPLVRERITRHRVQGSHRSSRLGPRKNNILLFCKD
jgi:hypothetical protein